MKKCIYISTMVMILAILAVTVSLTKPAFAENKAMGMVLEITGRAKIKQNNILSPANIMQPIYENSIVYTGKGSTLKFADYRDKQEYLVGDYSYIIFKNGKVDIKRGSLQKITRGSKLPLPKNTVLVSRKISGAVYLFAMEQGIKINNPKDKMVFASENIEFNWNGEGINEFEVIIIESGTKRILKPYPLLVKENRYKYSAAANSAFHLEYGKSYLFVVREKADKELIEKYGRDGVYEYQAAITFSLLSEEQAKRIQEAERLYREAVKKNPDDKTAMLLMADMYKESGMYRQAVDILFNLLRKDPDNPYVYYYIAEMYEKMKIPGFEDLRDKGRKLEKSL